MRYAFMQALTRRAAEDPRVMVLTADLGYTVFEEFAASHPGRFLNVGVAEANMVGVAAGLATCGKIPVTYTIATFATIRCLEQIRNDICAQHLNVKLIGVGSGFSYGSNGLTHHALEDMAVMRAMPGLSVVCPADPSEAYAATLAAIDHDGPVYLRLGRSGETKIHSDPSGFALGKGTVVREGSDCTIIATGSIIGEALKAARHLDDRGISAMVISMHTVKPLDTDLVLSAAATTRLIFTLEEHSIIGGLGSAVAEVVAASKTRQARVIRLGVPDTFCSVVGEQDYLRAHMGLDAGHIAATIEATIGN